MKICLVSNYAGNIDEGMRKVAFCLDKELCRRHSVLHLRLGEIASLGFWKNVCNFKPDIVHYVPGPSFWSFVITRVLGWMCGARAVMSAPLPVVSPISRKLIPLLKPDLILTQSRESENLYSSLNCPTRFFPNGVDTERFTPASQQEKLLLRQKYGLPKEKFYLLHIGPIQRKRGLGTLATLSGIGQTQAVIVGSTTLRADTNLMRRLSRQNCIIWHSYFMNIEDAYRLADCYIFPSPPNSGSGIGLPLSVMEAMACNLPVISTRFGGLPSLFNEGGGFFFADADDDFLSKVNIIRNGLDVKTREKVLPYHWQKLVCELEAIYRELYLK